MKTLNSIVIHNILGFTNGVILGSTFYNDNLFVLNFLAITHLFILSEKSKIAVLYFYLGLFFIGTWWLQSPFEVVNHKYIGILAHIIFTLFIASVFYTFYNLTNALIRKLGEKLRLKATANYQKWAIIISWITLDAARSMPFEFSFPFCQIVYAYTNTPLIHLSQYVSTYVISLLILLACLLTAHTLQKQITLNNQLLLTIAMLVSMLLSSQLHQLLQIITR